MIIDLGDQKKGIGARTNQFAPLAGVAFSNETSEPPLIPLLQHFSDIGGETEISQTSERLIAIKIYGDANWFKLAF